MPNKKEDYFSIPEDEDVVIIDCIDDDWDKRNDNGDDNEPEQDTNTK